MDIFNLILPKRGFKAPFCVFKLVGFCLAFAQIAILFLEIGFSLAILGLRSEALERLKLSGLNRLDAIKRFSAFSIPFLNLKARLT